jgi:hypothetical protein
VKKFLESNVVIEALNIQGWLFGNFISFPKDWDVFFKVCCHPIYTIFVSLLEFEILQKQTAPLQKKK